MDASLPPFSCTYTPAVAELLGQLGCSLALTTYQAGKVLLVSSDGEKLTQLPRSFDTPMGLAFDGTRLAVACKHEVTLLVNDARLGWAYPRKPQHYDAFFVPRNCRGRRVHVATLQPECWDAYYSAGPDLSAVRTKDGKPSANPLATAEGKALMAEWLAANPGVELVSQADADLAQRIADAVWAHPEAFKVLDDCVGREVAYQATIDGTAVKCQADLYSGRSGTLGDLKTIGKMLSERALQRQILDYGYHGQMAWYRRVMRACGVTVNRCVLIFVEAAAPHDVAVVDVSDEWLALGEELVDQALAAYAQVMAGNAVGRFPGVVALDVPAWATPEEDVADELEGLSDE